MPTSITRDVLDSYVFCKYKGYLKIMGEQGSTSDYETLLTARRSEVKRKAIDKIHAQNQDDHVVSNTVLTTAALKHGPPFVLDVTLEDDLVSVSCDGLKKVPGVSKLGPSLYIPMLFYEGARIRKEQRLLLEVRAVLLSRYQGITPSSGIIWHGRDCTPTTVRLNPDPRTAKRILADVKKMCRADEPPKLILNDHCQICEFRQRCDEQALQEDNLSLLRGLTAKEITAYSRKGIFTVTQLAHTFRPRRKGKRAARGPTRRSRALQAMALHDKRIYVLGTPDLPASPVHVYLDVESDPDAGFVYLVGLIVVQNGAEQTYSFWADTKEQEAYIFEKFVATVTQHEDFLVFCYGSYERAFITRMRKVAQRTDLVDRILNALVNILSVIYAHLYFPAYSNSLKEIGRCVGCVWAEPDASGIQSLVWRAQWEASHCDEWKQKLHTYNLDDCAALKTVTEILQTISTKSRADDVVRTEDRPHPLIVFAEDIEKLSDYHYTWGRMNFVDSSFEYVNNCAYFDYQHERVYVRTSKSLQKNTPGKTASPNRKLKPSRQLVIVASRCPSCNSADVISGVKKQVRNKSRAARDPSTWC